MITLRKLASLPRNTALRKTASLLQGFENDLVAGRAVDTGYLADLFRFVADLNPPGFQDDFRAPGKLAALLDRRTPDAQESFIRLCNAGRHRIYAFLGTEPADWDLSTSAEGGVALRSVLPIRIFLEDLRSPFNVGSIFRSAESFRVEEIVLTPACPSPVHPRAKRSAMGCGDLVPWRIDTVENLGDYRNVFALELGGTSLERFKFPTDGTVIIGNEELGVSPEGRRLADSGAGRVSIPLYGTKGSLNVSSAFAILIHAWCAALTELDRPP